MSKKRDIVAELLEKNCLITPDCYEILEDLDDDSLDVDRLAAALKDEIVITAEKLQEALSSFEDTLSEGKSIIDDIVSKELIEKPIEKEEKRTRKEEKDEIEKTVSDDKIKPKVKSNLKIDSKKFQPIGKKIKTDIKILKDSTAQTTIEGLIKDFNKYFKSRYKQMSSILRKRGDVGGGVLIKNLQDAKLQDNERISIIGMVTEKTTLNNGGMMLEIEDPSGRINVYLPAKDPELITKAGALLEDQVAGFFGTLYEDRLILDDFVFPDLPLNVDRSPLKDPISVCMTSDLHIGSKEFLEDSFSNLIEFLNGRVDDPYQQNLASSIKYFIICGDLVEGIGVYPKQEDDLLIKDIYHQYDHAAKLLAKIPEWIHIIIISGNHDACRLALPQPAIGKEYAPKLWDMKNVTMLSNPATVNLHGKTFLLYHGNSFEDVSSLTPGLSMNDPNGPMIYTLRYRHLAPTYGRRSSIVPSSIDDLVIENVPDVFHTGHIHINSHTRYRGVDCINSGTFQSQTDYMLSKNIHPTPGRVPIINLGTNKISELLFYENGEERS